MNTRTLRTVEVCLLVLGLTLALRGSASAGTISLAWNANTSLVAGYKMHIGTTSGSYSQHVDVGLATSYTFGSATAGQRYCFAVSAYNSSSIEGPASNEVCGYSNAPPTLQNPGNRSSTAGQSTTLQLVGSDPEGQPLTYSATGLPAGLSLGWNTGFISGTPTTGGTYSVTATDSDGVLSSAPQTFTWTVATVPVADTIPPTISITGPTSASTYATTSTSTPLSGTASDNVGVTQVTWVNDRGGNGVASGTTNWSVASIPLLTGTNTITVQARDAAGNLANDVLTVTRTTTPTSDGIAPTITITGPTSASTYTTTSTSTPLSGTASDNVGVTQVTWVNDRGGNGVASGTTNWSVASVPLMTGTNTITVQARDAAGNVASDVLTVTRSTVVVQSEDRTLPIVTITRPTSGATYSVIASSITVSGTSWDNVGVTRVSWATAAGESGTAEGTTNWSVTIPLRWGTNTITITARDAAGNLGLGTLTVTRREGYGNGGE
jgi:Putative Ig domain/Glucodextranase, domain B/Bacterial Ig domain